ncbi:hypothetical protein EJ08DRAFT_667361 [Tothia fuscella]|uniref:BTB domain-containing protein n=1 Tax=Tothia fuscella TaxID=1048955 RepID=A0A9P4P4V3_9PEZI|nr:hypothetical protein EJ08DRAFT_667361 [Tothia fuscella]
MVSYPDDNSSSSRSLSSRPARSSSIASSSRTSMSTVRRHHRHARSHAGGGGGGSSHLQNEFPLFFQTGDVEIVLASGKREQKYVLHRLYLSQASGFFEAGMSEEWSRSGLSGQQDASSNASTGSRRSNDGKRWRYELDWGKGAEDIPMLVQKPASDSIFGGNTPKPPPLRPKPPAASNGFFRSMANMTAINLPAQTADEPADETFKTYDNLFRIFYNYPPIMDSVNIANAYIECKTLLQLADMYDAIDIVGPRIDHHLLRFQGRLWKQIAKYPPSYLKLGYLARSKVIFQESLIHVVGQWPAGTGQLRGHVPQSVIDLIEDKVDELEETKSRVESKLWRLTLTTSRGERVTPHNSWLDWQMMSLWRQWFAENTTQNATPTSILKAPGPPPPLNTGRVFRKIGSAGSSYLGHDDVKKFLKISSELYSRDNVRRGERRLEELKNLARDAVKLLMRSYLELDLREGGLPYLLCTRMEERDWQLVFGDD